MGAFDAAVRDWLESQLHCPACKAMNKPHAKPTLEREQNGSRTCTTCSHNWIPKED